PHARGDDAAACYGEAGTGGSPPRAWGRQQRRHPRGRALQFTPTRVGTTPSAASKRRTFTVHPHARGDDSCGYRTFVGTSGSPPRAWGRRFRWASRLPPTRFTPTRVGTTPRCS